ncbi:MAG: chromosome partitioning protein ParB [Spirochaetes bacterium]|nr:MAG: chromosome partitioning protein ParB [Spirochaetota bacterium]
MQIKIDEIVITNRIRKDPGDLTALMNSMQIYGLLNPIIINKKKELVAGYRRLLSAKKLGWRTIEIKVVDNLNELDKLELEVEENVQRKNLSEEELTEGYIKIEKLRNPGLLKKIWLLIVNFFKKILGR